MRCNCEARSLSRYCAITSYHAKRLLHILLLLAAFNSSSGAGKQVRGGVPLKPAKPASSLREQQQRKPFKPLGFIYPVLAYGPNNQIAGLKEALVFGRLLDRTVIVHDILNHYMETQVSAGDPKSMKFKQIFDFDHLAAYMSIATLEEVRRQGWNSSLDVLVHFGPRLMQQIEYSTQLFNITYPRGKLDWMRRRRCKPDDLAYMRKALQDKRYIGLAAYQDIVGGSGHADVAMRATGNKCHDDFLSICRHLRMSKRLVELAHTFMWRQFHNKSNVYDVTAAVVRSRLRKAGSSGGNGSDIRNALLGWVPPPPAPPPALPPQAAAVMPPQGWPLPFMQVEAAQPPPLAAAVVEPGGAEGAGLYDEEGEDGSVVNADRVAQITESISKAVARAEAQAAARGRMRYLAVHLRPKPDECIDVWRAPAYNWTAARATCDNPFLFYLFVEQTVAALVRHRLSRLFVMTHPTLRTRVGAMYAEAGVRPVFFDMGALERVMGYSSVSLLAMVEQQVAIEADVFIGTHFSSMTGMVIQARIIQNKGPAVSYSFANTTMPKANSTGSATPRTNVTGFAILKGNTTGSAG